jgi:hypothetical protein
MAMTIMYTTLVCTLCTMLMACSGRREGRTSTITAAAATPAPSGAVDAQVTTRWDVRGDVTDARVLPGPDW